MFCFCFLLTLLVFHNFNFSQAYDNELIGYIEFLPFTPEDCYLPHTWGSRDCGLHLERYHWNNNHKNCVKVIYRGCQATKNNFRTLKECENKARPVCDPVERPD